MVFFTALGAPRAGVSATVDTSCNKKEFAFEEVRRLCEDASKGSPAVKVMMAKVTARANATGAKLSCMSCHTELTVFDLKPNAVALLRPLLKG
jgi:hypothetical protein